MAARTRTRVLIGPKGAGKAVVTTLSTGSVQTVGDSAGIQDRKSQTTVDVTSDSPPPYTVPHFFSMITREAIPPEVNGSYVSAGKNYQLIRWSNSFFDGWPDVTFAAEEGCPTMQNLALKAIANMNPNTPEVDIPLFLFELKDLPRMIKSLGDTIVNPGRRGQGAEGVLAGQLGLAPLIGDLKKLMQLPKLVSRRQEYLRQLAAGHHIRRKLGSGSGAGSWSERVWPSITGITTSTLRQNKWEAWYTAKVSASLSIPQLENLHGEAINATLGLQGVSASLIWNSIPWTWIIDYFLSLGDFIEAQRGTIPFKFQNLCIMRKCVGEAHVREAVNIHGVGFTPGVLINVHKRREVFQSTPMFGPKYQILSATAVRNLSALVLARDKRVLEMAKRI